MKRMHYMVGAIGLAPAAVGMAVTPAVASAATDAAGHAKTVSLHHVLSTTVRTNMAAASSSSSTAASPDTTAGCTGNTWFRIPQNHDLKGYGWYANSTFDSYTCIGTVDVLVHFNKTLCKDVTLEAFTSRAPTWSRTHHVCGSAGFSKLTPFSVHQKFLHVPHSHGHGVHVCVSSTYNRPGTCATVGS